MNQAFYNLLHFKELHKDLLNKKKQDTSYNAKVQDLIREKYTESEELAILRQKDTKPQEYQEYFSYCEECKTKAKKQIEEEKKKAKAKKESGGAENGV